ATASLNLATLSPSKPRKPSAISTFLAGGPKAFGHFECSTLLSQKIFLSHKRRLAPSPLIIVSFVIFCEICTLRHASAPCLTRGHLRFHPRRRTRSRSHRDAALSPSRTRRGCQHIRHSRTFQSRTRGQRTQRCFTG